MDDVSPPPDDPASPDDPAGHDDVDEIADAWRRERPGTPVDSIGVLTRIRRLGKLLDDRRRQSLATLGVDAATLDLLSTLRRAGPPYQLAPGEIARRTLVSAGAVSQRLARAEREGLIQRLRDRQDGRGVLVTPTPDGHTLVEGTVDQLLGREEALLAPLTSEQREVLAQLLRLLLHGVSHADRPPDGP